ncbi:MAG: hypothetical protein ACTSVI_00425 [Promethearchaeota archaeon]
MLEDNKLIWMENLFDIEKIIKMMESCDKDCKTCSLADKNDCLLEMRESIHSLAIHFKDSIFSFVELLKKVENKEEKIIPKLTNSSGEKIYT